MITYIAFSKERDWIEFGGFSECCALAHEFCQVNPDRVAYVGQVRGGEDNGRYIFEFTADSPPSQLSPPKFFDADKFRRVSAIRESSRDE